MDSYFSVSCLRSCHRSAFFHSSSVGDDVGGALDEVGHFGAWDGFQLGARYEGAEFVVVFAFWSSRGELVSKF